MSVTAREFATESAPIKVKSPKVKSATDDERKAQEAFVMNEMKNDEVARLRAEQKRIADELKALREQEKANRLADVIAHQKSAPNKAMVYTLAAALRGRVNAGQPRETATEEILAQVRELLDAADVAKRERKAKAESNEK